MGLKACDQKVFEKGTYLFTTHSIPAKEIDKWVKKVAKQSGCKVDWHYFGGRAVIKALGNAKKLKRVREVLRELLPEHDELMRQAVGAEFADICKGHFI